MEQALRPRPASLLLPMVIAVVAGLLGIALLLRPGPDLERSQARTGEQMGNLLGLTRPVKNSLSGTYVDANRDLIADTPGGPAGQIDPPELTFSYVAADENATVYPIIFQPLMDALSKATGKPVRYLPITDVNAQAIAVHDGTLHVCAFNTGSVPDAVDAAGFVPVSVLGDEKGATTYAMMILAASSSDITSLSQLKGQEIALTDPSSNSGGKAPIVMLNRDEGFLPGRDYQIRYSGGHEQSIRGLAEGKYAVIAVASDILARAEGEGRISSKDYRVLYASGRFPTACFGYAHQLTPELAARIRSVLTNAPFNGTALGEHFAKSKQNRLVPVDYANDFRLVRDLDDAVGYEHTLRQLAATTPTPPTTQPLSGTRVTAQ